MHPQPPDAPAETSPPLYTREFWIACTVHFTGALSLAMFVLVPLLVRDVGGSELVIGIALGLGAAVSVLFRPLVGALLDQIGRKRVLVWGGALNTLSWLPFLAVSSAGPLLFSAIAFHSIVWGGLFAAYFTYAADLIPPERRAEGIAVFGVAGMSANGVSPLLGESIIAEVGYDAFFLVACGLALLSLLVTMLVPVQPQRVFASETISAPVSSGVLRDMREAVRSAGLSRVLGATLVLGLAINTATFFVAPFTRDLGLTRVGPFFLAYSAAVVAVRILGRRLLDVMGPHRVSLPGFALFAAGLLCLVLLPRSGVLILAGIACGSSHGSLFPVLNALVVTRAPARLKGTVVSLHTAALDLGAVLGTPICGLIAWLFGYAVMFASTAAATIAGLLLMVADARSRRR